MKQVMLMGRTSCGKTTLCQRLAGLEQVYSKTQAVQVIGYAIDTPGEYVENRNLLRGLAVTAVDACLVLFLQSCTDDETRFSPGHSAMFGCPVIGVVTKADLADSPQQLQAAKELLELAGAAEAFIVSAREGTGIPELARRIRRSVSEQ